MLYSGNSVAFLFNLSHVFVVWMLCCFGLFDVSVICVVFDYVMFILVMGCL